MSGDYIDKAFGDEEEYIKLENMRSGGPDMPHMEDISPYLKVAAAVGLVGAIFLGVAKYAPESCTAEQGYDAPPPQTETRPNPAEPV